MDIRQVKHIVLFLCLVFVFIFRSDHDLFGITNSTCGSPWGPSISSYNFPFPFRSFRFSFHSRSFLFPCFVLESLRVRIWVVQVWLRGEKFQAQVLVLEPQRPINDNGPQLHSAPGA